jgi:hypothetical protein
MKYEDFKVGQRFQTYYRLPQDDTIFKIHYINALHCKLLNEKTRTITDSTLGNVQMMVTAGIFALVITPVATMVPSNHPIFTESDIVVGLRLETPAGIVHEVEAINWNPNTQKVEAILKDIFNNGNCSYDLQNIVHLVNACCWKVLNQIVASAPSNHPTYDESDIVVGLQVCLTSGENWEVTRIGTDHTGMKEVEFKEIFTGNPVHPILLNTVISQLNNGTWTIIQPNSVINRLTNQQPTTVPAIMPNKTTFQESDIILGMEFKSIYTLRVYKVIKINRYAPQYGQNEATLEYTDGQGFLTSESVPLKTIVDNINQNWWIVQSIPVPLTQGIAWQRAGNSVTINGQFIGVDMASVDVPKKKCTCDSKTIFNYGCRCGAFHEGDK